MSNNTEDKESKSNWALSFGFYPSQEMLLSGWDAKNYLFFYLYKK